MVAGQSLDLLSTGKPGDEKALLAIYRNKTGRLIAAPVVMAAILSGKYQKEAEAFGLALGTLFQLTDDILDAVGNRAALGKSIGKDAQEGKLTAVSVYGLEGARRRADESARKCLDVLHTMESTDTGFLTQLTEYVRGRDR